MRLRLLHGEQIPLVRLYEMYLIAIECSDNSAVYQPLINQLLTARSISLDMDNAGVDQKNQFVSMEYHKRVLQGRASVLSI